MQYISIHQSLYVSWLFYYSLRTLTYVMFEIFTCKMNEMVGIYLCIIFNEYLFIRTSVVACRLIYLSSKCKYSHTVFLVGRRCCLRHQLVLCAWDYHANSVYIKRVASVFTNAMYSVWVVQCIVQNVCDPIHRVLNIEMYLCTMDFDMPSNECVVAFEYLTTPALQIRCGDRMHGYNDKHFTTLPLYSDSLSATIFNEIINAYDSIN